MQVLTSLQGRDKASVESCGNLGRTDARNNVAHGPYRSFKKQNHNIISHLVRSNKLAVKLAMYEHRYELLIPKYIVAQECLTAAKKRPSVVMTTWQLMQTQFDLND